MSKKSKPILDIENPEDIKEGDFTGFPPTKIKGMPPIMGKEPQKPTPEQEKYLNLIRQLTDASVTMVVKVAICECKDKDNCGVFIQAQNIAKIINELQSQKPVGVKVGKSRAKIRNK